MCHAAVLAPLHLQHTCAWSVTVSEIGNTQCGTIARNTVQTVHKLWLIGALYLSILAAFAALPPPRCLIDAAQVSGSRADGFWALATHLWRCLAAVIAPVTGQAVPCAEGLTSPAPPTPVLALARLVGAQL